MTPASSEKHESLRVNFTRSQVQLLQREGAGHSLAPANGSTAKIGGYPAAAAAAVTTGEGDSGAGGGFGAAAGEKRFADLLDARLGEERIVQVGKIGTGNIRSFQRPRQRCLFGSGLVTPDFVLMLGVASPMSIVVVFTL